MDYWCYALINNQLGEIYFTLSLYPHERWTIRDAKEMQHDIPTNQFIYYRHHYRHVG